MSQRDEHDEHDQVTESSNTDPDVGRPADDDLHHDDQRGSPHERDERPADEPTTARYDTEGEGAGYDESVYGGEDGPVADASGNPLRCDDPTSVLGE